MPISFDPNLFLEMYDTQPPQDTRTNIVKIFVIKGGGRKRKQPKGVKLNIINIHTIKHHIKNKRETDTFFWYGKKIIYCEAKKSGWKIIYNIALFL